MKTKLIIGLLACIYLIPELSAQTSPPGCEWKTVSIRGKDILNNYYPYPTLSGDEWWFSHKNLYAGAGGTTQVGYVAVGYIADLVHPGDENKIRSVFNEGPDSPHNIYPAGSLFTKTGNNIKAGCEEFYNIANATPNTEAAENRTEFRGIVARLDLRGNMIWCRLPNINGGEALQEVIQHGSYIYVIGTHNGAKTMNKSRFIAYNPTSAATYTDHVFDKNRYNDLTVTSEGVHMYIAKYDLDGNQLWEAMYGTADFTVNKNDTWNCNSLGFDLIINSTDTSLYAVGRANTVATPAIHSLFVTKINPVNGYLVAQNLFPLPATTNTYGDPCDSMEGRSICETSSGNMAIGAKGGFPTTVYVDHHRGYVYSIAPNLTLNSGWATNPINFSTTTGWQQTTNIWEVNYHKVTNEVLVGLLTNCYQCSYAGNNHGEGQIYRIAHNGTFSGGTNPSLMGQLDAYDLRIGVTETADGGFAAVSTRYNGTFALPTPTELGTFTFCTVLTPTNPNFALAQHDHFGYWDTDPLIVKFNSWGVKEWEWSEDIKPGRPRATPPGDLSRHECMYKITEAQYGGLVISGNASSNHDDFYMVKLYGPCNNAQTYSPISSGIVINGNVTWNTSQNVRGVVSIEPGAELTVTGSTTKIRFADTEASGIPTYIEVKPGGRLTVTGGAELTSISNTVCPASMWSGISVMGTYSLGQVHSNTPVINGQGIVDINGGSTISNARTAITTGTYNSNGNFDWGSGGGIIWGEDSYFINNNRDVQYMSYPYKNIGGFYNCSFLTNDRLNDGANPTGRVSMWAVDGVTFQGCKFEYNAGNSYAANSHGYGIKSVDARYTIEDYPTSPFPTRSSFKNLNDGVWALNTDPLKTVNIDHAVFTKNMTMFTKDIILSSMNSSQIVFNEIGPLNNGSEGIYLNECQNYAVNNNTITGLGEFAGGIGIIATQSRGGVHRMYRNNFTSLIAGILPTYQNSAYPINNYGNNLAGPSDGLVMNCNTFSGNHFDIAAVGDNYPGIEACVAELQGVVTPTADPTKLVRNKYSASCGNDNQWAVQGCTKLLSHAAHTELYTRPLSTCGSPLLNVINSGLSYNFGADCDAEGFRLIPNTNPCKKCALGSNINQNMSQQYHITSTLTTFYRGALDGGNTPGMLDEVNSPSNSWPILYTLLQNKSPYLSDAVLKLYFSSAPVMDVIAIHALNAPVKGSVWDVIVGRAFGSPDDDTLVAHQALQPVSARSMLEHQVAGAWADLQGYCNEKLNYLLADTAAGSRDSVIAHLAENRGGFAGAPALLVNAYAHAGAYARAFEYADSLSSDPQFTELMIIKMALLELDTAYSKLYKLKTDSRLYGIVAGYAADSTKSGSALARAALHLVEDRDMYLPILMPYEDPGARWLNDVLVNEEMATKNQIPTGTFENGLKIYPNPANKNFILYYSGSERVSSYFIIRDVLGKEIDSGMLPVNTPHEMDTQLYKNGVYFITLIQGNILIEKGKVIIMK